MCLSGSVPSLACFPLACAAILCHGQDRCAILCMSAVPLQSCSLCQHLRGDALSGSALTGLMRCPVRWLGFRRSYEIKELCPSPTNITNICNSSFSLTVALLHHATAWGCEPADQPAKSGISVDSSKSKKALLQVLVSDSCCDICSPLPGRRGPAVGFALHPAEHKAEDL